jgi:hypothetical protein
MQWLYDLVDLHAPILLIARSARWTRHIIWRHHLEGALSWLLWLLAVMVFAVWILRHYQPPAAPAWIGQTIRTTVFAIWMLIIREYVVLRLLKDGNPAFDQNNEDQV